MRSTTVTHAVSQAEGCNHDWTHKVCYERAQIKCSRASLHSLPGLLTIQPAQAAGLLLSFHLDVSNAALNFLLGCLISVFSLFQTLWHHYIFIRPWLQWLWSTSERGWCQRTKEADLEIMWKHFYRAENGAGQLCFSLINLNELLILPSIPIKRLEVEFWIMSMFYVTETGEKHWLENLFISAHVQCKWSVLPATVGLIASLLSHPPGLACNEIEAFVWNDLSHPLSSLSFHLLMCTHLSVRKRRWVEDKEGGEIAFELQR